MHNTHNRKRKERVQIRVQIANRFITKKELDSAYFCLREINERKVIAVMILLSFKHNRMVLVDKDIF